MNILNLVFRKKTHSNRYISPLSCVPVQFICSTMNTLKLRALRYCTNLDLLKSEFDFLTAIFVKKHGYPLSFVRRFFDLNNLRSSCALPPSTQPRLTLPYFGSKAVTLAGYLRSVGLSVTFKPGLSLHSILFKATHTTPLDAKDKTNVVYLLYCTEPNCSCYYIGETTRTFGTRLREHVSAISSSKSNNEVSAITRHARITGHMFDFLKFLDSSNSYHDLMFKEAVYILSNEEKICNDRSVQTSTLVSPIWLGLRDKFRVL